MEFGENDVIRIKCGNIKYKSGFLNKITPLHSEIIVKN